MQVSYVDRLLSFCSLIIFLFFLNFVNHIFKNGNIVYYVTQSNKINLFCILIAILCLFMYNFFILFLKRKFAFLCLISIFLMLAHQMLYIYYIDFSKDVFLVNNNIFLHSLYFLVAIAFLSVVSVLHN